MAMNRRQRARRAVAENPSGARIDDAPAARSSITLDIGEVILRGIDAGDRNLLAEALERELVLALGARETIETLRSGAHERVNGGVISLEANHSAPAIGRQIAQVVQRSLIASTPSVGELKISKR
jgi:hypothetical protein